VTNATVGRKIQPDVEAEGFTGEKINLYFTVVQ